MNYTLLKRILLEWATRQGVSDPEEFADEMIKYAEELIADQE